MKYIYLSIIVLSALVILFFLLKMKNKVLKFALYFGSGLALMCIINLTTEFTGLSIPVNYYSLGVSSVLGIPGDLLLIVINRILL